MTRINRRRAASIAVVVLYVVAFSSGWSLWFLVAALGIMVLELWIQRATEIGWRFFRHNLDERQEELQNRVLAVSYRLVVALVLVVMVFLAAFGWYVNAPRSIDIPGQFAAMVTRSTALILVILFLLPGHVSAWLEPVSDERHIGSVGAER